MGRKSHPILNGIFWVLNIAGPYYIILYAIYVAPHIAGAAGGVFQPKSDWRVPAVILTYLGSLGIPIIAAVVGTLGLTVLNALNLKTPYIPAMVTRLVLAPAAVFLILLTGGMFNPWFLWASWVPPLLAFYIVCESAIPLIGTCICSVRKRESGLISAIAFGLLAFVPGIGFFTTLGFTIRGIVRRKRETNGIRW